MEGRVIYLGQMPTERMPPPRFLSFEERFVLGEVRRRGSCYVKLTARPPTEAEMQRVIVLANKGLQRDAEFVFFVRRLIEAQGGYAKKRLRATRVKGRRLSRKSAGALRRLLDARGAVIAAEVQQEREIAERHLRLREEEYAKQLGPGDTPELQKRTFTGGVENDHRVWRSIFPVGGGQADVPYDLRMWVQEGKLIGEIVPRLTKGPFARGSAPAAHRAQYIVTLVRMALHGSFN